MGQVVDLSSGEVLEDEKGQVPVTICFAGTKTVWVDREQANSPDEIGILCAEATEASSDNLNEGSVTVGFHAQDLDFIKVLQSVCELGPTTLTFCDPEIAAMLEDMPNFVEMTKFDQIEIEDPEDE